MYDLDSASKGGSDEYLNLSYGRKLRPAGRVTRDFEGRRQCLNDARRIISFILCSMKSRQHSLKRARNFQFFYVQYLLPSNRRFGRGWQVCSLVDVVRSTLPALSNCHEVVTVWRCFCHPSFILTTVDPIGRHWPNSAIAAASKIWSKFNFAKGSADYWFQVFMPIVPNDV